MLPYLQARDTSHTDSCDGRVRPGPAPLFTKVPEFLTLGHCCHGKSGTSDQEMALFCLFCKTVEYTDFGIYTTFLC